MQLIRKSRNINSNEINDLKYLWIEKPIHKRRIELERRN